jgi:lipid-A-disaccharide synthase
MKPKSIMVIAGEASGDLLAAELVQALRAELASAGPTLTADYQPLQASLEPRFFGAGGPQMAAAGVELAFDLTRHSVIGLSDVLKGYLQFRRLFHQLYRLALEREPDAIVCVDFSGFNRRFASAIKKHVRSRHDWFHDWNPRIIQYVSPQVWASREGRVYEMERAYDLLLSTFAFEKAWYAKRVPKLPVEFVGNPVMERCATALARAKEQRPPRLDAGTGTAKVVLLPGSRQGELRRHVPVLGETAKSILAARNAEFTMVVPSPGLADYAKSLMGPAQEIPLQVGRLEETLTGADLAITKSGTITLECAYFGVPAVVFYKTSTLTYLAGRQMVKVKYLAMPNLLANEAVFPEFIQNEATPQNIGRAALELLGDAARRQAVKTKLAEVVGSLGSVGASQRAAQALLRTLS